MNLVVEDLPLKLELIEANSGPPFAWRQHRASVILRGEADYTYSIDKFRYGDYSRQPMNLGTCLRIILSNVRFGDVVLIINSDRSHAVYKAVLCDSDIEELDE